MRILVTGATGVVGRRAVPLMIAAGRDVTAAGRSPERMAALRAAGASVIALDLFDVGAVRQAVQGHDAVVNLATHIPHSSMRMLMPGGWRENDRIRRDVSAVIADAAADAGVTRLVQESFAPIYEDGGAQWLDERAPVRPVRYNRTVLDAERAAQRFNDRGGAGVVLRFAYFYGDDSPMLHDMLQVVRLRMSPIPGRGDAWWSSISHDDAATAVVSALTLPAGVYNVADDEPLVRRELLEVLARAIGTRAPKPAPAWMTKLMGSMGELLSRSERISNRKLRAQGWAPRYRSIREGLFSEVSVKSVAADQRR